MRLAWSLRSLLLLGSLAVAAVSRDTNANRLRDGLTPLEPAAVRASRTLDGRVPTRPNRRQLPSAPVNPTALGYIAVYGPSSSPLGYLSHYIDTYGTISYVPRALYSGAALVLVSVPIAVTTSPGTVGTFAMELVTPSDSDYPYLGVGKLQYLDNGDIEPGTSDSATLTDTMLTPAGSAPSGRTTVGGQLGVAPGESTIWTIAADGSGLLTATWTQTDGITTFQPTIGYVPLWAPEDSVYLLGDIAAFDNYNALTADEGAVSLSLYFIPQASLP